MRALDSPWLRASMDDDEGERSRGVGREGGVDRLPLTRYATPRIARARALSRPMVGRCVAGGWKERRVGRCEDEREGRRGGYRVTGEERARE